MYMLQLIFVFSFFKIHQQHYHTDLKITATYTIQPRDQFFEGDILSPDNKRTVKTNRPFLMLYENILLKPQPVQQAQKGQRSGMREVSMKKETGLLPSLPNPAPFFPFSQSPTRFYHISCAGYWKPKVQPYSNLPAMQETLFDLMKLSQVLQA